jgi:hypothetical protein
LRGARLDLERDLFHFDAKNEGVSRGVA